MSSPPASPARGGSGATGRPAGAEAGLLALVLIWGVNFSVIKAALESFPPLAFNAIRFPLAALVLLGILGVRGRLRVPDRRDVPRLLFLAVVGHVAYQALFIFGIDRTLAGNAAILTATSPVWTTLIATGRGQERPRLRVWLGVVAGLVGVALVVLGGRRTVELGGSTLVGDLLVVIGAAVWAVYTVEGRDLVRRYGALEVAAWTLAPGALGLAALGMPAVAGLRLASVPALAWAELAYAGVLGIGIAYFLWYRGVGRVGSSQTAVYANLVPVVALLVAWAWLGESPGWIQLGGAAVVLGGMTLTRMGRDGPPPNPPEA